MIMRVDVFFNTDMMQNLVAEVFGIAVTVLLVDRITQWRQKRTERSTWRSTRGRVGWWIGWEHTVLRDKLDESNRNAYEIFENWCMAVLEKAKEVKQQYAFAFTAEMAGALEKYESYLLDTVGGIRLHQWRNLDTLELINGALSDFLRAADVSENDIEHTFRWSDAHTVGIRDRLASSDLNAAHVPEPPKYWR
jgi:hypothetical protein